MGGYLNIEECIFDGNSCGDTGAAIDNLVDGSLMVVKKSKFVNNRANTIGGGNYGAVTVFPGTFAVIDGCDFTGEDETAIDWTKGAEVSFEGNTLNPDVEEPVIENPVHSRRSGIETIKRYALVLANRYKYLKKLQGVPKVLGAVKKKHRQIYEELAGSE